MKTRPLRPERLRQVWPAVKELALARWPILALAFVLMLVHRASSLVLPASTKFLIDDVVGNRRHDLLAPLLLAVIAATLVQGGASFALAQLLTRSAQELIADLRSQVHAHVLGLPLLFFDANKSGSLVSRIMNDVDGIRNLIGTGLVELVGGLLTAVVSLFVLIRISASLTGLTLVFIVLFALALRKALGSMRPRFRERAAINAEVTARLTESLAGIRVVKGYRAESQEQRVFTALIDRLLKTALRTITASSIIGTAANAMVGIVGAIVMYVGARQIVSNQITLGDFVTFTAFIAFLVAPVGQTVGVATQLTEAVAGLDRTCEILRRAREDDDPQRTVDLPPIRGNIVFEAVRFAYEPGKTVLHDIGFDCSPDTVTALVGSSGSGKSTIISLVAAFYKPAAGRILVDGVDLSTVTLDSYRKQLAVVLQDTFLFDGTIAENVGFARPGASWEDILEACRFARVDEFAERLADGYHAIVGERGVKLSGGQRQRVSIARAILADPRILILDEATSSLDSESEALIQEGLKFLMKGRTTFVVAHRLSTIRRSDLILVVEQGRVVERGNHTTLHALGGRYRDLYDRQYGAQSNLFLAPGEGEKNTGEATERALEHAAAGGPVRPFEV